MAAFARAGQGCRRTSVALRLLMGGGIEAAGEFATGALIARAVEPERGAHAATTHAGTTCLNCGTALVGDYCHACGQSAHVHRTLMSIGHDLLHGVFHFEGKIWRTIPMLVRHPGQLTRRYIAGERARFVSPLALFLFTVFLMFAIFSAIGPGDLSQTFAAKWQRSRTKLEATRRNEEAALTRLQMQRARLAPGQDARALDREIADQRDDLKELAHVRERIGVGEHTAITVDNRRQWLDEALQRARANPGLVVYKVQSAAYKFSWALIFLSTPFVALLFLWRRRFGLYDHATFVTYSISFMSLLVIAIELLIAAGAPGWISGVLLIFAPPIHMFAQLKGAYSLGVLSALWRTLFLLIFSNLVLTTFVVGVIMLEVAH